MFRASVMADDDECPAVIGRSSRKAGTSNVEQLSGLVGPVRISYKEDPWQISDLGV